MNPYIRFYLQALAVLLPVAVIASLLTDLRLLPFLGPYVVLMMAACVGVLAAWELRIEPW